MHPSRFLATSGFGMSSVLLLPAILIVALPAAVGIGVDIFYLAGEAPVALALAVPVLIGILCHARPHASVPELPVFIESQPIAAPRQRSLNQP